MESNLRGPRHFLGSSVSDHNRIYCEVGIHTTKPPAKLMDCHSFSIDVRGL